MISAVFKCLHRNCKKSFIACSAFGWFRNWVPRYCPRCRWDKDKWNGGIRKK